MKDLKAYIQKNNMKKLMLSAVLGMFYYCTNNAMEDPQPENPQPEENKKIKDVLTMMLQHQVEINKAREEIKEYEKKIYFQISVEAKVTKKEVITFIKSHYPLIEVKTGKEYENDIKIFEQYYHLEEIKGDDDECTKENLTEIFWEETKELVDAITGKEEQKIKKYFKTIIDAEKAISEAFEKYYDAKKEVNKEAQYENILKDIMNDCCSKEIEGDLQTKFLGNLNNLCETNSIDNKDGSIITAIKRRITLKEKIEEEDFISFLKQKIVIEEKKEEEKNQGGGCPCC